MVNGLNRRNFLKKTAAATFGTVAMPYIIRSSALDAEDKVAPSNRLTIGCIGVGGQGTVNMEAFLQEQDVQVVAVCDVNRQSSNYYRGRTCGWEPAREIVETYYAAETQSGTYKGCKVYTDFRELLARDDIDAVSICTPDHWHSLIAVAAAEAGKDIYCEKPLANSVAESRAICNAVSRYNRILQTGSHERSRDNARFACELVRNGRIGKLHTIRVNMPTDIEGEPVQPQSKTPIPDGFDYDMWLGPAPWAEYTEKRSHLWWRYIFDYGGGEVTDRGAHIIDLAQLGNDTDDTGPVEITANGWTPKNGLFNTFMQYEFECKYANGARLVGQSSGIRGIKFEGTEGWVFIHIHGGNLKAEPKLLLKQRIKPGEIYLGRTQGHHRNFLDAVKTRRQPMAPAQVGHRSITICHLINIAMLTGQKLTWDPDREQITNSEPANRMLYRPMRSPWHL